MNKFTEKEFQTKIGTKGYTIVKDEHLTKILNTTKKYLSVKPYVGADYGVTPTPFAVYKENKRKLYLPRYYGIEHFGHPDTVSLGCETDENINMEFKGNLKPIQVPIVSKYMNEITYKEKEKGNEKTIKSNR